MLTLKEKYKILSYLKYKKLKYQKNKVSISLGGGSVLLLGSINNSSNHNDRSNQIRNQSRVISRNEEDEDDEKDEIYEKIGHLTLDGERQNYNNNDKELYSYTKEKCKKNDFLGLVQLRFIVQLEEHDRDLQETSLYVAEG